MSRRNDVSRETDGPAWFAQAHPVSRETLDRLTVFAALLRKWQSRINLVGPATLPGVWRRHILDSAQLAPLFPPQARMHLDMGSGAGFPGLVLAVLALEDTPERETHLVESDGRKAAFLREAARRTGARVTVHACRLEALQELSVDIITARALAPLPVLMRLGVRFLRPCGQFLLLKGARAAHELTEAEKEWTMAVEHLPSRTDPSGVILRIQGVRRREHAL